MKKELISNYGKYLLPPEYNTKELALAYLDTLEEAEVNLIFSIWKDDQLIAQQQEIILTGSVAFIEKLEKIVKTK